MLEGQDSDAPTIPTEDEGFHTFEPAYLMSQQLFRPIGYHRPRTVREAIVLLKRSPRARPICGGTDVMVERDPKIKELVDLGRLPLDYIKKVKGAVLIGATATIRKIELSPIFREDPLRSLHDATCDFGTIQVRNMASIGGNLCNGIPSADMPPSLVALEAQVTVAGSRGHRTFPLEKLYRNVRKLSIKREEILTEIRIPKQEPKTYAAYVKLVRSQVDIALVSAAVRITLSENGKTRYPRIVLGAVAPTPLRAGEAEDFLCGREMNEVSIKEAGERASRQTCPISDVRATVEYRKAMSGVLVERALRTAVKRSGRAFG